MFPLLAATDIAAVLTDLFIVLLAAKLGDEIFKRIGQPAIVGEILAGLLVGPSLIGLVEPSAELEVFAELGVVFLLFWVGLEMKLSDLREVGSESLLTGLLGALLPFAGGLALGLALGEDGPTSVFIGAALVATSVGITSAVLIDLGVVGSRPARTILGAGVVDDVIAMLLLAIAAGTAGGGETDLVGIGVVAAIAIAFVIFVAIGGTRLLAMRPQLLKEPRFSESPLLPAVIICLGLAAFAAQIGLAAIIGAFLAGIIVAETKEQHPIEDEVAPLYAFFPPFFFALIGIQVELEAFADIGALALLAGVTAVAVATKLAGAYIGSRRLGSGDAAFVAFGMVPRGEVGIIVAGIGKATGVISDELFAVIVGMSIVTTLAVPPVLRSLAPKLSP
jgi:Kef-type K+ transport system membrane component KefB